MTPTAGLEPGQLESHVQLNNSSLKESLQRRDLSRAEFLAVAPEQFVKILSEQLAS